MGGADPDQREKRIETMRQPGAICETQAEASERAEPEGTVEDRPGAVIHASKQAERAEGDAVSIGNLRDFEAFLRKRGGFSRADAKRIAKHGYESRREPEAQEEALAELLRRNIELLEAKGRNHV